MKPLPILLLAVVLSGCVSEKRRAKICQTCPVRIETTTRDSIVQRDSIITIQGEVLRDTIKIECDELNRPVISYKRPLKGGLARMEVSRPDLSTLVSTCIIDSQAVAITWQERHTKTEEVKQLSPLNYGVTWQFALVASIICLLVGFIYGAHKSNSQV